MDGDGFMLESVEKIIYDGRDLVEEFSDGSLNRYLVINNVYGRSLKGVELTTIGAPFFEGDYLESIRTTGRFITVDMTLKSTSFADLRKDIDALNHILVTDKDVTIEFGDEPGLVYYGRYAGMSSEYERSKIAQISFNIFCSDPYKYAKNETELELTGGLNTIKNDGTAPAKPIIRLTAKENSTYALIENQYDEYMLLGIPADDDQETIETRKSVLYENGSTLDTWRTATNEFIDPQLLHKIDGEMTTDDAGIRARTYGEGDKLHGPAIYKELPKALQDFEIETTFDIISRRPEENWRIGINFLDENMNMLGHIGIKDNHRKYKRRVPLARYGPYRGSGRENGNLIGNKDAIDNARETTLFYLNAKREGDLFSFYIGEWQNLRHIRAWEETYLDLAKEYAGRIKFITLYVAKYGDRPSPSRLRINSVEVFELSQVVEDTTPYIVRKGDEIMIDCDAENVFINGRNAMHLRHIGSDFFHLESGYSTISVEPAEAFDGKVTFRERYR